MLLVLDISGSTAGPGPRPDGHHQQRTAIANLTVALHDLGDRVALYAYYSQGRTAVNMVPVKRFDDHLDARVIRRLNSLEPGAYSRLGAAIRHGSAVLETAAARRGDCWWWCRTAWPTTTATSGPTVRPSAAGTDRGSPPGTGWCA